ncbi:proteasome activator complex subunit 3 isoform X2 [Lates japonicus]|uniref:Proteasome activator complex subunit 3 isoform X2 n=1 Tax=Lates japonicus TaxID=270547 RepID=A0AAD3MWW3_LATJO|nr:proteasome activator complex subunit 3 isoform X2 [Lates japonicus]
MWVQLLIPKIEDGNNFGVSIQEETVAELRTVESQAASYLDQISRYYITRAKLVSKITKYPHVVTLHDMILKIIEEIKKPRSRNSEALY